MLGWSGEVGPRTDLAEGSGPDTGWNPGEARCLGKGWESVSAEGQQRLEGVPGPWAGTARVGWHHPGTSCLSGLS